jgi:hypothetical protein
MEAQGWALLVLIASDNAVLAAARRHMWAG